MRFSPTRVLSLCVLLASALTLRGQDWDGATKAQGWARQDKDDSFTFYDPGTKVLHTWMRDGGELRAVPLGKLESAPGKWIIDPRGNAWVVSGTTLTLVEPTGRLARSLRLPAEVGSVCWDTKGFILSYRARSPYLEKRRYQDGDVLWTYGTKPNEKDGATGQNLHPLLMDDLDHILLGNGRDLNLVQIGAEDGKRTGEAVFMVNGSPGLTFNGAPIDRGPLCLWSGKNVAFAALRATDLPEAVRGDLQDQVLARIDLSSSNVTFLPTGLTSQFLLVGVLDGQAVFVNPKGGLMLVPVK